jgi:hypothetical protein
MREICCLAENQLASQEDSAPLAVWPPSRLTHHHGKKLKALYKQPPEKVIKRHDEIYI